MKPLKGVATVIAVASIAIACKADPVPAPRAEALEARPEVQPPGACRNVTVEGDCHYTVLFDEKSMSDKLGERIFSVSISARVNEWTFDASLPDLSMDPNRLGEAEEHYRKASPAHCKAFLVRPPCPPSSHVELDVPPPPFATVVGR